MIRQPLTMVFILWIILCTGAKAQRSFEMPSERPPTPDINIIGNNPARTMHGLPRFVGHNDLMKVIDEPGEECGTECQEYGKGIAGITASGIVMLVLTFLGLFFFCFCRFCCNKCGKRKPREGGYTKKERFFPLFIMLLFATLVAVFSGIGYAANSAMSKGFVTSPTSVTKTTVGLLDDVNFLLEDVTMFMSDLELVIFEQIYNVSNVVQSVSPKLNAGTAHILNKMTQIEQSNFNVTIGAGGFEFACLFCDEVSVRMGILRDQVSGQTEAQFNDFEQTIADTDVTFVTVEGNIRATLNDVAIQLTQVRIAVDDQAEPMREMIPQIRKFDKGRRLAFNIVFAIPLISFCAVILGAILRWGIVFKLNYILCFLTMFIMWALYTVHAPVAAMSADVCYLLDEVEQTDWALLGDIAGADSRQFLTGCLADVSLVETFNVTSQMNFRDVIAFPVLALDIDALFDFSELASFQQDAGSLDTGTFGGAVNDQLAIINDMTTPTVYGRNNLSSWNPSISGQITLRQTTLDMIAAEASAQNDFQAKVDQIKHDTDQLMIITDNTKATFTTIVADMNALKDLMEPIFDKVDSFRNVARCGFLGVRYGDFKKSICVTMLGALGTIVLALFLIGIFLIPLIIISIVLGKRIGNPMKGDYAAKAAAKPTGPAPVASVQPMVVGAQPVMSVQQPVMMQQQPVVMVQR